MTVSLSPPQDRIRIFDRAGLPLAEFRAAVDRSWSINEEARAEFTYPSRKTQVVNDKVLRFGNWLYIQSTLLPDWVGIIDVPREWSPREVIVKAYTPERLFSFRRGPAPEQEIRGSAGELFGKLIEMVNKAEGTILRKGEIWAGGNDRVETIAANPLNEDLARIAERSGDEYDWRPVISSDGRLIVYADWFKSLGTTTGCILQEGKGGGNLKTSDKILTEDGPIINDLLGSGEGATWRDKKRFISIDHESVGRYGLRQGSEEFQGVTELGTVTEHTRERIVEQSEPSRMFEVTALNVGSTFDYLKLGNRLTLRLENAGFYDGGQGMDTNVRIMAMNYEAKSKNALELIVEKT